MTKPIQVSSSAGVSRLLARPTRSRCRLQPARINKVRWGITEARRTSYTTPARIPTLFTVYVAPTLLASGIVDAKRPTRIRS
jgi:hypothetical protein